jgi:hypothetical protein
MTHNETDVRTTPHVIVGDRYQVVAALRLAQAEGRLQDITEARALPGGRVRLAARLLDLPPARTPWQRIRPWLTAVAVLLCVAAAVALVWLTVLAVMALIALVTTVVTWIWTHLVVICLVILGLLFLGAGGASCVGMHCGGCRG